MIRALLIDLDGVIRIWDGSDVRAAEARFGLPAGTLPSTAFEPDLVTQAITGEISDDEWRRQVAVRLHQFLPEADATEAVDIWSSSAGRVDETVLALVRQCRRHLKVVLVTNATSRLPADLGRLNIEGEFDAIVNSSEHDFAKPEAEIYQVALDVADVIAGEALFVDDRSEHVAAAITLGISGFSFTNAASLRAEFMDRGLL